MPIDEPSLDAKRVSAAERIASNARMQRRRVVYLNRQNEEAERAGAALKIKKAEELFAQERRRLNRSSATHTLEHQLRAKGFVK